MEKAADRLKRELKETNLENLSGYLKAINAFASAEGRRLRVGPRMCGFLMIRIGVRLLDKFGFCGHFILRYVEGLLDEMQPIPHCAEDGFDMTFPIEPDVSKWN